MPTPRVIETSEDFPIKPGDIDATVSPLEAFGNQETEASALYILLLMQQKGDWLPFTREEVEALYNEKGYKGYSFNHLIGEFRVHHSGLGWPEKLNVIVERDGKYFVTDEFVLRCYYSSPVLRQKTVTELA